MSSKLVSRRRFLHRTRSALGAALTIPNLIPASALGSNGAMAPSERITMGFEANRMLTIAKRPTWIA